jgi:hypothetical protein
MQKLLLKSALAGAIALPSLSALALTYSVTAVNGATATADFTFGADSLSVVLTDTTVNPGDVGFNLSALTFSFAGGTGGTLASASSPDLRAVNSGGTFSDSAGPTTMGGVGWVFSTASNTYKVDVLSGGGAGPAHTILGSPGAGGIYSAANASIAGNGPHNPFLENSATFDFTFASGVSAATALSEVSFQFGTTDGTFVAGVPAVPEPQVYALMLAGLAAIGFLARRRRRS